MTETKNKKLKKRDYRCKAHVSSFKSTGLDICKKPEEIDWKKYFKNGEIPKHVDIGCGYGRFLFKSIEYLDGNVLGIEIRKPVCEFVKLKLEKLGIDTSGIMNTNAMLFLVNFFGKSSLENIFILYPDPHFKKSKQKGRVVCKQTVPLYEYLLKENGKIYISTDVKSLYDDMRLVFQESAFFEEVETAHKILNEETFENNQSLTLFESTYMATDEASRAGVKTGEVYASVFRVIKK